MTAQHRVQCPRCHTLYPMPAAKLGDDKARATCGKCQHTFFLNAHLVDSAASTTNTVPATANKTPAQPIASQTVHSTATTNKQVNDIDSTVFADDIKDATVNTVKPAKKIKSEPVASEGMIHDDMISDDTDKEEFGFDESELDAFMKNDAVVSTPIVAATAKDSGQATTDDEAWLNTLLQDNEITVDRSLNKNRPDDNLSDILGVDIDNIIPVAEPSAGRANQPDIYQKIQARLENHAPTQEQLAKKRSVGSQLMWLLGCLLMVGLLGLQYIFFNTDSLIKNPEYAATLNSVCGVLPCNLPIANSQAFRINHDIKPVARGKSNLIATITNTAHQDQLYPNLKVTFVGDNGVIGELVATPKDYLTAPQRLLASNQQKSLMLGIDLPSTDIKSVNIEPFF